MNQFYNQLAPVLVSQGGISCLFGYEEKSQSLTSINGPLIPSAASIGDVRLFIDEVMQTAKRTSALQVVLKYLPPLRKWDPNFELEFLRYGFKQEVWKTLMIDLHRSEADLFGRFRHAARKAIKKALSMGVRIQACTTFPSYHEEFLIPYLRMTNREIRPREFYEKFWNLDTENIYHYWVAKDNENNLLGSLGTYRYDGVATEIMSALSPFALAHQFPAQDLLHWDIIRYHQNIGDAYFDLAGFNPSASTPKESGIRRFKEKWGAETYDTSSYLLDRRSLFRRTVSALRNMFHV